MQSFSIGDNLHKMSDPVFWEKYNQSFVCWICPECDIDYSKYKVRKLLTVFYPEILTVDWCTSCSEMESKCASTQQNLQ